MRDDLPACPPPVFPPADSERLRFTHRAGCRCALHGRRLFGGALLAAGASATLPAWADGVQVPDPPFVSGIVPAADLEQASAQEYAQMLQEARAQNALAPDDNPQLVRLRAIATRLIPHVREPNLKSTPRAADWKWEVNLLGSDQINAFCMPGGKIAFFYGILEKLQLTDDEVAMVMGHEVAHALREHARARIGKSTVTNGLIDIGSAIFGLGNLTRAALGYGGQALNLKFSRGDESEADKIGLDLGARAGYDPRAGVTLWQKMAQATGGSTAPSTGLAGVLGKLGEYGSTHPAGPTRIRDIEANLPVVEPLYAKAAKPPQRYAPPGPRASKKGKG